MRWYPLPDVQVWRWSPTLQKMILQDAAAIWSEPDSCIAGWWVNHAADLVIVG